MNNKGKNIIIGIFITTTILLGVALAFFIVDGQNKSKEIATNTEKINEYETKLSSLDTEISKYKAEILSAQKDSSKQQTENKSVENTTTSNINLNADLSKVKNARNSAQYEYKSLDIAGNMSNTCRLDKDGKVNITIGSELAKSFPNYKIQVDKNYTLTGFNNKVVDVYCENFGQGVNSSVFLFLMEDGTVEYLTLKDFIMNGKLQSSGKISDLKNIIKIKGANIIFSNGGSMTSLAISKTGEVYDIGKILEDLKVI